MRILLVEDEPDAAKMLAKGLREEAYAVDVAGDGERALEQAHLNDYDLIVLDVMLPRKGGFEVCRELRAAGSAIPVLMLTARDAVEDRSSSFVAADMRGLVQVYCASATSHITPTLMRAASDLCETFAARLKRSAPAATRIAPIITSTRLSAAKTSRPTATT